MKFPNVLSNTYNDAGDLDTFFSSKHHEFLGTSSKKDFKFNIKIIIHIVNHA